MGNLLYNPSFEEVVVTDADLTTTNWHLFSYLAPSAVLSYDVVNRTDGISALLLGTGALGNGGYTGVNQSIYEGFAAGDILTVRLDRWAVTMPAGLVGIFRITALSGADAVLSTVFSQTWSGVDGSFQTMTGTSSEIPAGTARLYVEIFVACSVGGSPEAAVLFDNTIVDVIPRAGSVVTDASVSAGKTHDVAFLYDDTVGPVGFTITRDKNGMLAYFQEEAPVFGDPRVQSDSSASDFTLWRTTNQTDFSEGQGYVDFDQETGKKRFQSFKNGMVSDVASLKRGPYVYTGGSIAFPTVVNPPDLMSATTYNASGGKVIWVALHDQLAWSIDDGASWVTLPKMNAITSICAFQQQLYVAFGKAAVMKRTGVGDAILVDLATYGQLLCADEGIIVKTLHDANNAYTKLEQSVDGTTWTATTSFSDGSDEATGCLRSGFFQGLFHFSTQRGLYSWDGTATAGGVAKVVDYSTAGTSIPYTQLAVNGKRIVVWRGDLYFTVGRDLVYKFDGARPTDRIVSPWNSQLIGPNGLLANGSIEWIDLCPTAWHLYALVAALKTDGSRVGFLYAFDGKAWTIAVEFSDSHRQLCTFDGIEKLFDWNPLTRRLDSLSVKRVLTGQDAALTAAPVFTSSRLDLQRAAVPKLVSAGYLRHRNSPAPIASVVTQYAKAGQSTLVLSSVASFAVGDYLWIDPSGDANQVKKITAISGATVVLDAPLSLDVPLSIVVYKIHVVMSLTDVATGLSTAIGGIYTNAVDEQLANLPIATPFVANRLTVSLRWFGTTNEAEIVEWAIRYIYAPEVKRRWRLSLDLRHGVQRVDGEIEDRTTAAMIVQLWAAKGARRLIQYFDIDGTEYLGRIAQPEIRVEERKRAHDGITIQGAVATLQVIETDSAFIGAG